MRFNPTKQMCVCCHNRRPAQMTRVYGHPLLVSWTIASATCIVLPMVVLFVGHIIHAIYCSRTDDYVQWCQKHNGYWGGNRLLVISAFVWCYIIFAGLAVFGHGVLTRTCREESKVKWLRLEFFKVSSQKATGLYNLGLLTGAVILFGNLSFILGMLLSVPLVRTLRSQALSPPDD